MLRRSGEHAAGPRQRAVRPRWLRGRALSGDGVVTVAIPAWQASAFIDRTLRCARAQTHEALRIVVAVDRGDHDDGTEAIARAHADEDDRIEVHAHAARLGWAANTNFLLDRLASEFGFLYFHDDVIEPTYCERLVDALRRRPDAASAHCAVGHFGGGDRLAPSRSYDGTPAERLLTHFVAPDRGSLLRSMLRTERIGPEVRLPTAPSQAGVWANQPFVMRLVAAGPVVGVDDALYHRWEHRQGGLTDGWRALPVEAVVEGYRTNAESAVEVIDSLVPPPTPDERTCLLFGLHLFLVFELRRAEDQLDAPRLHRAEELLADFAAFDDLLEVPPAVAALPEPARGWCEDAHDRVLRRTGRRALHLGAHDVAARVYAALAERHPDDPRYARRLARARAGS